MAPSQFEAFERLRAWTFAAIDRALAIDGHCKSYEGTFRLVFPGKIFIDSRFQIELSCYVLGPSRFYTWEGETWDEALDRAAKGIQLFVDELNEWDWYDSCEVISE